MKNSIALVNERSRAAIALAENRHSAQMGDAAFDCAAMVLNGIIAAVTFEVPPIAAGFAYSAITNGINCSTKIALISSSAGAAQYDQAACALELLSPSGALSGLTVGILGGDTCTGRSLGNSTVDVLGTGMETGSAEYVLGNFSKGKWGLASLMTLSMAKLAWNINNASYSSDLSQTSERPSSDSVGGKSGSSGTNDFVPQSGPGQHAEP